MERERLLLRIARKIHETLDLSAVFRALVEEIRPVLAFDRASILMVTEDGSALEFRELEPEHREHLGRHDRIPIEGSAAGEAVRTGEPLVTHDLEREARYYEDPILRRAGIRSRVILPLRRGTRVVGTFNLASTRPEAFSEDDLTFLSLLAEQVGLAVVNAEMFRQVERTKARLQSDYIQFRLSLPELDELIGDSPPWRRVLERIEAVARTDATVMITGETGTGKELVARAIHRLSGRRNKPFVPVHCAALAPGLIASELFGHERGAFTGADRRRLGRLEIADGGTVFLDEVAEIPPDVQVQLLRVLQERAFERVGGTETIRVNVRVIAATNRDLGQARAAGRFRDDLFFRLNVFPISLPPLRERREDIEPLLRHFLRRYAAKVNRTFTEIDPRTIEACMLYDWPGNVRELENMVERTVILSPGPVFHMDPLRESSSAPSARFPTFDEAVREHLVHALRRTRGKIYGSDGAAALLGLKPSTLQSKLRKYGIDRREAARASLEPPAAPR